MATQVNDDVLKRILGLLDSSGKEQQEFTRDLGFNRILECRIHMSKSVSNKN